MFKHSYIILIVIQFCFSVMVVSCGSKLNMSKFMIDFGVSPTVNKTIGWDANPEHEILTGYKLYFGAAPGIYDGSCVVGGGISPVIILISELVNPNNPDHTIKNFKVNSACYFAISSYNAQFESALSGSIAYNP